jgi:recombination protein RecA
VKIVKNKVAPPFREAEFDILYGEGASREGDVLDLAVTHGIVDKAGAWYSYKGERIGQGRENVRSFLKENVEVFARVDKELREKLQIGKVAPKPADLQQQETEKTEEAPDLFDAAPNVEQVGG